MFYLNIVRTKMLVLCCVAFLCCPDANAQFTKSYSIKTGLNAKVFVERDCIFTTLLPGKKMINLGKWEKEPVDAFLDADFNKDGYRDFAIGASGGTVNIWYQVFLFDETKMGFTELMPRSQDSLKMCCNTFSNIVPNETEPGFTCDCRIGSGGYAFDDYRFKGDELFLYRTMYPESFSIGINVTSATEQLVYNFQGDTVDRYLGVAYDWEPIIIPVTVSRLDLYTNPNLYSNSGMYLIEGDKMEVLEDKDGLWLKIRYQSKTNGEIEKWVYRTENEVDKYAYRPGITSPDSLELTQVVYDPGLGEYYERLFTLSLDNHAAQTKSLYYTKVHLLFVDENGQRFVHFLYGIWRGWKLPPFTPDTLNDGVSQYQPSALLDDNVYELADGKYMFTHGAKNGTEKYVRFFPKLKKGTYRMIVILMDDELRAPLYSNERIIEYVPPKN